MILLGSCEKECHFFFGIPYITLGKTKGSHLLSTKIKNWLVRPLQKLVESFINGR